MTNKKVRPIMTAEARDALDRMTANYELRSDAIIDLELQFLANNIIINEQKEAIRQQESSLNHYMRESNKQKESRNYWMKVAGISTAINWGFLVYTAIEQGLFL